MSGETKKEWEKSLEKSLGDLPQQGWNDFVKGMPEPVDDDEYKSFFRKMMEKANQDNHIEYLYQIQLFDYNCPSCVSGVTNVFTEDIEDFSENYLKIETDEERKDRFLRSKAGEIVIDYYSDDPELNIVKKVDVKDCGGTMKWRSDTLLFVQNGYGWPSGYFFKLLALEVRWIRYGENYYKLVKPRSMGCCHKNLIFSDKPWWKMKIHGNPFWLYRETIEVPFDSDSADTFRGTSLESYVWQVAEKYDTEAKMLEAQQNFRLSDEEITRVFADLSGDAG